MSKAASTVTDKIRGALRRAVAALQRADYVMAIALARGVTQAEPAHAETCHLLGQALSDAGRSKEALAALLHALALDPSRAAAHAALGQVLLGIDAAVAAGAYGRAAALDPGTARFWGGLGT